MISMSERRDFQQMRTAGVLLALLCSTRADSRPFTVGAGSPCIRKGDGIEDCKETFIETETIKVLEEETSVIDIGGGEEVQTRLTVDEGLTSDDSLAAENIAKVLDGTESGSGEIVIDIITGQDVSDDMPGDLLDLTLATHSDVEFDLTYTVSSQIMEHATADVPFCSADTDSSECITNETNVVPEMGSSGDANSSGTVEDIGEVGLPHMDHSATRDVPKAAETIMQTDGRKTNLKMPGRLVDTVSDMQSQRLAQTLQAQSYRITFEKDVAGVFLVISVVTLIPLVMLTAFFGVRLIQESTEEEQGDIEWGSVTIRRR